MGAATIVLAILAAPAADCQYGAEIARAVTDVAHVYPVPADLVRAVIRQESGFRPNARSSVGARGLMQVMKFNARRLGVTEEDLWDPAKNILAGTRLLAVLLKYYQGDLISVLTAYNSGPKRPLARIPNNGETPGYIWRVIAFYESYRKQEEPGDRTNRRR